MHRTNAFFSYVVIFLLGAIAVSAAPQDDRLDELDFEEAPVKEEVAPYFAIGVGTTPTFGFQNLDDINVRASELGLGNLSNTMTFWGGEVFGSIGAIVSVPNLRAGFSWLGSVASTSADVTPPSGIVDNGSIKRTMEYQINTSTIHLDYVIPVTTGLVIAPGTGFGFGSQVLTTYQGADKRSWTDYSTVTPLPDMISELNRSVYSVPFRLNIEYTLTPFILVRAAGMYRYQAIGDDWQGNRTSTVTDVPSGINISGFNAQVGIFVGLFNN
ncbi:MAG: hypothetical protein D8M52_06505 [Chlorobi bacterium]|nr:MAG: hypothetical protein UZ06_CHB003001472 [Chlorobi bacterium OLB6]MBL1161354.1 hypothetical protein [Chlorobiota bacterium]MBV6462710.1 hypothetical protein [Chlorobiota bacterium]MCL4277053.1 hypothetical protein [Ignavibacteria bacterium]NOG67821.1 hypothetical protein [Chlorobiota bacterium]